VGEAWRLEEVMDSQVPAKLRAGDTWEWSRSLADYPAPTWVLTYRLKNDCDDPDAIVAVASGTDHAVTVAAATTAVIKPGRYRWFARVTSGALAYTVEEGWVDVEPDASGVGKFDPRTDARKMLEAVEATLYGRASRDQQAMSLNGRSISRTPLPELWQWRDKLRAEVKAEDDAASHGAGRNIKVRVYRG
jgi:hypothetical protein